MNDKSFTPADMETIAKKMRDTQNSDVPFAVITQEEVKVVGDANKTEVKKNDYEMSFRVPVSMFEKMPPDAVVIGSNYKFKVKYENITITPRQDLKIVDAILRLQPFFNQLNEDGKVAERTNEELLHVFAYAKEDILLSMYQLVATFLNIDDVLGEYMEPFSVIGCLNQLMDNHPEIFREADVFFG